MSYHAIENLVEDAVQLLEGSALSVTEQRKIIFNLYQFQNRFDTSYTVLRCFLYLEKIGFIKKLPIDQHPDYKKSPDYFKNLEDSDWLLSDVNNEEADVVYQEDGNFFPEYGSDAWKRLLAAGQWKEAPEEVAHIPIPHLIAEMIELSEKQGNKQLMHNFYLAFVNAYLEADIGAEEGLTKDFEQWINNPDLIKLHELLSQHDLLKIKKKETDFEVPRLSDELSGLTDPDERAKLSFLMDPKKSIEKIYASYLKEKKAALELPQHIEMISSMVKEKMEKSSWTFLEEKVEQPSDKCNWVWYKDLSNGNRTSRLFMEISLDVDLSSIFAIQYVQHGLLLEWQEKSLSKNLEDAQFKTNPFELIDNDEVEKNLNFLGLWVLPLKSSGKRIATSTEHFLQYLDGLGTSYLDRINKEFPKPFFAKPFNSYIKIFESMDPISDFLLFNDLYSISQIFIHNFIHQGKEKEALKIYDTMEGRLTDRFRENIPWYKNEFLPFIKAIKAGKKPALPGLFKKN
ncbi:hypothetical protein [Sphingobacterium sp.]|uniref:hypothetical protein n=1 Tax=Sphingobacterium sp. TaxID=341027 RepID=UPI0028B1020C|nr:hypothetical protein [Sphingobacterium sp.]